jgi:hypothetical protein
MGSFLAHRPIMKARMLMAAEQMKAKRVMITSSMARLLVLLLADRGGELLPRCAGRH